VADIRARAARPLIVSSDEESGRVSRFRELVGTTPSPRRLAAGNSPAAVRAMAKRIGSRLAAVGVNLDLAPVVDLDAGPAGGIVGDRSFSDDPTTAAAYALAYAQGLSAAGVTPTAKHFPGHGRTPVDTHVRLPTVDVALDELMATDARPFAELIGAGVPAVMMNHVAYTALDARLPASLSPRAYRLLRDMGFRGVALTDSIDMGAVNPRWSFGEATVRALQAGADGVVSSDGTHTRAMRDAVVAAVTSGRLDERRLNEAAGRVLALAGGDAAALACQAVELPALAGAAASGP
jgi:beta-N-acetylhexosaminidase